MLSGLLDFRLLKLVLMLVGLENSDLKLSLLGLELDFGLDLHCSYPGFDFVLGSGSVPDLEFVLGLKFLLGCYFAPGLNSSFDFALLELDFEWGNLRAE